MRAGEFHAAHVKARRIGVGSEELFFFWVSGILYEVGRMAER